jgi:cation diffusion facilitator CzcD-associated flavoprotein CzcO
MVTKTNGSGGGLPELDAVVIGAGFSGLYALYKLRDEMGMRVRVYEAADGVGGTWYWNRYPGARCDSESHYYSYSFSEELEQEWEWTSKYPEQPEILRYLNHVADRFDLRRDIQFETRVEGASFDEARNRWRVRSEGGEEVSAHFLISAVGCLSAANLPKFEGLESFEGEWYHTGLWPREPVDFTGKRVGLVGTGSTGIQATPVIAERADHLTVFQRTPNYSLPARNARLTPEEQAEVKANYRALRQQVRESRGGFPYAPTEKSGADYTPEEQQALCEELWKLGGFRFLWGSFNDIMTNQDTNDVVAEFVRKKIREVVEDPKVAEFLTPTDHPYGTKRPPIDTGYYEAYNRDNVTLVDVRSAPIEAVTPHGLRTADGMEYELDTIVFATGFDAITGALQKIDIRGTGGRSLSQKWEDGPRTYLGLQVAGFPNMFIITGPGSPSVLTNMPVAIEQHVDWIADCIEYMRGRGVDRIEAKPDAEERWVDHVNEVASTTLYQTADSWYVGANIPGKKRVFMPYVGGMIEYRKHCDESARNRYDGFEMRSS